MELRVAAPQIEGACPPGQLAITQGAEKGQLATQVLERAQILLVIERERLVTRDGDDGPRSRDRLQPVRFLADIGCRRRYFEQAVDVDALFHQLGHLADARGELLDLVAVTSPRCRLSSENASSAGIFPKTATPVCFSIAGAA